MASDDSQNLPDRYNPPEGRLLIYRDGALNLQVRMDGKTVWMPQRLIAELYQVSVKTANEHLVNIYAEGEPPPRQLSGNSG